MILNKLSKEEWLKRCETVYDWAREHPVDLMLLRDVVDAMARLEGGQLHYFVDFLEREKKRTDSFDGRKTLANDRVLYALVYLTNILSHPCQKCAEDKDAWRR